jgi:hypothetical protein
MKASEIERLIGESGLAPFLSLNSNGRVDCEKVDLKFSSINWRYLVEDNELKFPFGIVVGFDVSNCNLKSMKNFPLECCGDFRARHNELTSIKGIPPRAQMIDLRYNPITSFEGIGTKVKSCKSLWMPAIESHMLGVLQIKDLRSLYLQTIDMSMDTYRAFQIVLKYIDPKNRNIVQCQRELIENDLDEYAEF